MHAVPLDRNADRDYNKTDIYETEDCHAGAYHGACVFYGGLQLALKTGGNVLLVDQRAHGGSDGHTITFGIRERRAARSVVS